MKNGHLPDALLNTLGSIFTKKGIDFFVDRVTRQIGIGIMEEAIQIHSQALKVREKVIAENYWKCWSEWRPKNRKDLFVYADRELSRYCIGTVEAQRFCGRGLFLYLAARDNFRCHYAKVPLLPGKWEVLQTAVRDIAQRYAWYPSVDHVSSTVQDDVRHSLANLSIVGRTVNDMFGHIGKQNMLALMQFVSQQKSVDQATAIHVGRESLLSSARKK